MDLRHLINTKWINKLQSPLLIAIAIIIGIAVILCIVNNSTISKVNFYGLNIENEAKKQ